MTHPISPSLRPLVDALEPRLMLTGSPQASLGIGHPAVLAPSQDTQLPDVHQVTGVDVAHSVGLDAAGQTVVVIDSGVAYDHPALGGGFGSSHRVVGGWDFTEENDADPYDDGPAGYHGTHVAGILASSDPEHLGVAPGADIVALRVFNDSGRGKLSWLESSLQWVIENQNTFEHPITTVNMSIGTTWNNLELPDYAKLEDELQALHQAGIFVSAAAGNRFDGEQVGLSYPAVSPHVFPAASSDSQGQLSDFSQRNTGVLVVPGEKITSTVPDFLDDFNGKTDDFYAVSGTSMAAPYLAGVSMLIRQSLEQASGQPATVDAIYDVLAETSDSIFDATTGKYFQRVNVGRAIDSIEKRNSSKAVVQQADVLIVSATSGDDDIQIDQRGFVRINGALHEFDAREISFIQIGESGGNDRLTIDVRRPGTHIDFAPSTVEVTSDAVSVQASSFDRIDVISRANDVSAAFRGSDRKDQLFVKLTHSWMTSGDSVNYVSGVSHVTGVADDVIDTVVIYDTPADDQAIVTSESAQMTSPHFSVQVEGYSTFSLRSNHGGNDSVTLVGTSADDVVRSKESSISLKSDSHFADIRGYEHRTIQGGGGKDRARLFDSPGDDQLVFTPERDTLTTPGTDLNSGTTTSLHGFTQIEAFADQGFDSVSYLGSDLDETFVAKPTQSWATLAATLRYTEGFDYTVIDAAQGSDSVWLYDSLGNDEFAIAPNGATARGIGFEYVVTNSEFVHAHSRIGSDRAVLVGSKANDHVFAKEESTWMRGEDFTSIAEGFHRVETDISAEAGGRDLMAAVLASLDDDDLPW